MRFSQLSQILIRSRLISFHMLYTTPQTAGIALHATSSPYFTADAFRLHTSPVLPTFHFSCCAAPAPFLAAFWTGFSTCSTPGLIHTGHHRAPHPRYPQSTLSHRHGTILHQRHLFLPFCPTHDSRPLFLTFRPLHHSHHLMRGHIPCQHILHQYQPL